jgi:hypothetical protein
LAAVPWLIGMIVRTKGMKRFQHHGVVYFPRDGEAVILAYAHESQGDGLLKSSTTTKCVSTTKTAQRGLFAKFREQDVIRGS